MLRPTVSRPVCLGISTHLDLRSDFYCQTVAGLLMWGALFLTRGRVCRLQLLLVLASVIFFGSDSHGTRNHNLLSQIRDFLFRCLLRLAGLRWRYSTPPPHGTDTISYVSFFYNFGANRIQITTPNGSCIILCVNSLTTLWFLQAHPLPRKRA
jgi:hypothetical protein